jgi:hypothetical protein
VNEEWRVANQEWRLADEELRVANKEWRMAREKWRMADEEWRVANQEVIFFIELAPFVVQQSSVGLHGVLKTHIRLAVFNNLQVLFVFFWCQEGVF